MALVEHNFNGGGPTLLIDALPAVRTSALTNGNNGVSKLALLQARFQQKQLQEKEQKLLQLYESQQQRAFQRVGRGSGSAGSSSVSSTTSSTTSSSSLGNGKVRQLFDERRTQTKNTTTKTSGWDRSYPLEPLETNRSRRVQHQNLGRGVSLERIYTQPIQKKNVIRSKSQVRPGNIVNGGYTDRNRHQEYNNYNNEDNNYIEDEVDSSYHNNKINSNRYHNNNQHEIDQLFTKSRPNIYDEEPLRDGETFDDSQLFKKLSNVGGILLMKERTMNEDKYKTYNANSKRVVPTLGVKGKEVMQKSVTQPLLRRRENDVPSTQVSTSVPLRTTAKPAVKPAVRKPEPPSALPSNGTAMRRPAPPKETASAPLRPLPITANKPTAPLPAPGVNRASSSRGAPAQKPAASRPSPRSGLTAPPDNLSECQICGRRFASDRVAMHQTICAKTAQKKRKVFDPVKQRVKGTEAEAYVKIASKQQAQKAKAAPPPKKSDWRRKHEEFINAIRAAKEVKAHLAAGGKLSDLPPPPPSENLDYVQCPHCSRRFNESAAERHIPRCADMQHNKPKAKAPAAKSGLAAKKR